MQDDDDLLEPNTAAAQEGISKITKDLLAAARIASDEEARFLVDSYYAIQKSRIQFGNQNRALTESGEPNAVIGWLTANSKVLERQILRALSAYADAHPMSPWLLSVPGIGPVLCAGLLAHIDIKRCTSVGDIWRFAGLDPTSKWQKGKKRPWNASLKVLCWKIGESFTKVSGNEKDFYGKIYKQRKEYETAKNLRLEYAEQAREALATRRIKKDTEAYKAYSKDMLPAGRIHLRAQRYAVKLFLSHLFELWFEMENGRKAPASFALAHLGHVDYIPPPMFD